MLQESLLAQKMIKQLGPLRHTGEFILRIFSLFCVLMVLCLNLVVSGMQTVVSWVSLLLCCKMLIGEIKLDMGMKYLKQTYTSEFLFQLFLLDMCQLQVLINQYFHQFKVKDVLWGSLEEEHVK